MLHCTVEENQYLASHHFKLGVFLSFFLENRTRFLKRNEKNDAAIHSIWNLLEAPLTDKRSLIGHTSSMNSTEQPNLLVLMYLNVTMQKFVVFCSTTSQLEIKTLHLTPFKSVLYRLLDVVRLEWLGNPKQTDVCKCGSWNREGWGEGG